MLVLIIHLARATHRTAHVQSLKEQLQSMPNFDVRIQDAVDGSALPTGKLNQYVGMDMVQPSYPFPLTPGEVGCFLSHREAWQAFLNSPHEECVILEDDADIDLSKLDQTIKIFTDGKAAYAQLPPRKPRTWPDLPKRHLALLRPPTLGTTGQILTRKAAELLLKKTQQFDRPIDTYLQMTWHHGVPIQTLYPSMIGLAANAIAQTTIQGKKSRSTLNELGRSWHRLIYRRRIRRMARLHI